MLPAIRTVASVEMIRDGGSLQAGFFGANGSKYCLHFKLISEETPSGGFVRLGYDQPVVFERLEIREENRIEWYAINQVEVSWAHAKVLLHQLRPFLKGDQDKKWFAAMEEIANTEGDVPDAMPRVVGPVRHLLRDADPIEGRQPASPVMSSHVKR